MLINYNTRIHLNLFELLCVCQLQYTQHSSFQTSLALLSLPASHSLCQPGHPLSASPANLSASPATSLHPAVLCASPATLSARLTSLKGTVQRDRFSWKWYQSIDLSLNVRRRNFQLILTAHSRVRGPLSFRATSYEYLQLSRQFPIMVHTSFSGLFLTPFCHSQLR
jgi:hypothetical protein